MAYRTRDDLRSFQERFTDEVQAIISTDRDVRSRAEMILNDFSHQSDPQETWNEMMNTLISAAWRSASNEATSRLARLVIAFTQEPAVRNNTGEVIECDKRGSQRLRVQPGDIIQSSEGRFLLDLPGFANNMRFEGPRRIILSPRFGTRELARTAWTSHHAFLAYLCHIRDDQNATCDLLNDGWMERAGLEAIRQGLEQPDTTDDAHDNAGAAARWLSILGGTIHANTTWGALRSHSWRGGREAYELGGKLWLDHIKHGEPQIGRWEFWKQRLADISGNASFDSDTRCIAKAASEEMALL